MLIYFLLKFQRGANCDFAGSPALKSVGIRGFIDYLILPRLRKVCLRHVNEQILCHITVHLIKGADSDGRVKGLV